MPRANTLPSETDDQREGYVVAADTDLYVGDRIRVRDVVKKTGAGRAGGMTKRIPINGIVQTVRVRGVRTTIADVTRVAVGRDGATYVTGTIVTAECEGEDPLGNDRWRHKIGTSLIADGLREIARLPGTGPSEDVRDTIPATMHSTSVRMRQWSDLVAEAEAAGIDRPILVDALVAAGDRFAQSALARRSSDRVGRGGAPCATPADLGEAEASAVRTALAGLSEPEHWMWPVVANAIRDPEVFLAEFAEMA